MKVSVNMLAFLDNLPNHRIEKTDRTKSESIFKKSENNF